MTVFRACLLTLLAGLAAMIACAFAYGAAIVLRGWLVAVLTLLALPVGSLLLLLVDHLIPENWSLKLAGVLEAAALTAPGVGLAFLPLLLSPGLVWQWAGMGAGTAPWPEDWPNPHWLTPWFFALRSVVYFAVWSVFAILGATRSQRRSRPRVAALGLVCLTLAATLAAFDWGMSLEPGFRSTIYGLIWLGGQTLAAMAFAILAARSPARTSAQAGVLLSLVLLWGYVSFCQYLVVWSGDLPGEIAWYLRRVGAGWPVVVWAIGILGAALFLALVPGRVRHSPRALAGVAAVTLALHVIEGLWLFVPAWDGPLLPPVLAALAALLLGGGLWGSGFVILRARRPAEVAHGRA